MSSTAALSKTLKSITILKIRELEKQRRSFEARKNAIFKFADEAGDDQRERVRRMVEGVKQISPSSTPDENLQNIQLWIDQSHFDASIPDAMLVAFEEQLRSQLDVQTRRLGLADLYSRLLTEWLNPALVTREAVTQGDLEGSFEIIERDRLKDLQDKFEAVVFTPLEVDEAEIENYLSSLFEAENGDTALEQLRGEVTDHVEDSLKTKAPFDKDSLRWCLKGLLNNELLSDDKKAILQEFLQDDVARGEICDVLNMKLADIENWSWDMGAEGMPVEPRRQLNGKYRIMMDEDILQAIFLHYIGMTWSVAMKRALLNVVRYAGLWNHSAGIPAEEIDRRRYYLGTYRSDEENRSSVDQIRQDTYEEDFFLSQLPSSVYDGAGGYDEDDDEEDNESEDEETSKNSPKEIKQQLLRQLATDVHLRQALDGEAAVVQSDLQWFATSISHGTIFAVLRFIGMPEAWITFFKKFLEAPLRMAGVPGDTSVSNQVRIRKRGVPMAHALEKFFGELILFFMDLAVNQEADMLLYRFHDDLWLCGQPKKCANAWQSMERFAAVMGLEFNFRKTGSVYLTSNDSIRDAGIEDTLPNGPVSVGFLTLDPQTGNWVINQQEVGAHVKQLQKQLANCDSILSWVQTWNSCIGRFFSHTFGEPANCFGRQHVDSILDTYKRMQAAIFSGADGTGTNVTAHLKHLIATRFSVTDVPDAFIFMPESLGGLGLLNPFVSLFLVREQVCEDPGARMREFFAREREAYVDARKEFEELGELGRRRLYRTVYGEDAGREDSVIPEREVNVFISFEDYVRWRECGSAGLKKAYEELLKRPTEREVRVSKRVREELGRLAETQPELALKKMDAERKWIVQLHSAEVFGKCGGLSIVEKNLLPLGVLAILRKRRVSWEMVL